MANVIIEEYDRSIHENMLWYIDDTQADNYRTSQGQVPYFVCLTEACGYKFIFHSVLQIEIAIEFFSRVDNARRVLPIYEQAADAREWGTYRWFDNFPLYLQREDNRLELISALTSALCEYKKIPQANTGKERPESYKL